MMHTVPGTDLDASGYREFIGNPFELQEGDLVQDGKFAVLEIRPDNHNGEKATRLDLALAEEYNFEVPRGGIPKSHGRSILINDSWLGFKRLVDGEMDFGEEAELAYELAKCAHEEHENYNHEWRGKCRDVPKGMLVGINLELPNKPVRITCQIVDSVYGTGMVLFEGGRAYQSHPDKGWIGWTR